VPQYDGQEPHYTPVLELAYTTMNPQLLYKPCLT